MGDLYTLGGYTNPLQDETKAVANAIRLLSIESLRRAVVSFTPAMTRDANAECQSWTNGGIRHSQNLAPIAHRKQDGEIPVGYIRVVEPSRNQSCPSDHPHHHPRHRRHRRHVARSTRMKR